MSGGNKRPFLIWVITVAYGIAVIATILGPTLMYSGMMPITETQRAYFDGLGPVDWFIFAITLALMIMALATLFALKKSAPSYWLALLIFSAVTSLYTVVSNNRTDSIPGLLVSLGIMVLVVLYVRRLRKRAILT